VAVAEETIEVLTSIEGLEPGAELDNEELRKTFGCGSRGGMRRSLKTNTLVIISDHVSSIYEDRWISGVMHYTAMGTKGDQSLDFMQNKTLTQSGVNGVDVHLFEVLQPQVYTYVGEVALAAEPYQETQADDEENPRVVWVFPLAPKSGFVPALPIEIVRDLERRKAKQARRLSDDEVAVRARRSGRKEVGVQSATTKQFQRSVWVAEHAKRRANGVCDLCDQQAPFNDKTGQPYLETHHIEWLARGGADTIENTVALCPNCHKRMHVLDNPIDLRKLRVVALDHNSRG
jgi:5-methylcytosine-specific restriction protein A